MPRKKFHELAQYLQGVMEESLPKMMRLSKNARIFAQRFLRKLTMLSLTIFLLRPSAVRPRDHDDPHDDAHPEGRIVQRGRRQMSQTVDEAKLRKVVNEMLRQRCTLGDEHQFHIDQMQNFLKNNIVWESRKEILISPYLQKSTPVVQSYQRDPKAPALSLVNQDLLYLKKGNSCHEKIVLSLHKFHAVIFPDDDIKERTSRWVDKYVKKFNPYARYRFEHWKNQHAKIFYIKRQMESGKLKEVYSNSNIVQVIKTYGELGHEHKFVTEIIARRANGSIVSITEPNYKNLNKNDIEDMYLLCINDKSLERVENYNNYVKHGYVTSSLSKEDAEYLQLFEEEIEERLKHHDQMRHWEMYMNERPLGSRRERPE
ncbi:hypothetical protein Tco_0965227 [Tanacetum coccineum]